MDKIIGIIKMPPGVEKWGGLQQGGLVNFLSAIVKLMIVGAGLFTLFNIILAGYSFLSAGDDKAKIEGAWAKIWQSALGLTIAAGSLVLAAIFGYLIFRDARALIQPQLYGPGSAPAPTPYP